MMIPGKLYKLIEKHYEDVCVIFGSLLNGPVGYVSNQSIFMFIEEGKSHDEVFYKKFLYKGKVIYISWPNTDIFEHYFGVERVY